ncbi:MAG TPA: hypothetical protein QGI27_05020, partial [Flavobacteriaceae bacterium]|nr:hypothetical protein [Flavobacteriaceae bacterium]
MSEKYSFEYNFRDSINTNKLAPLIIMLHGYGSNEDDLFSFASDLPRPVENSSSIRLALQTWIEVEEYLKY